MTLWRPLDSDMATNPLDTPTTTSPVWLFRFALEHEKDKPLERSTAEELMDLIVAWAETNSLQIGGGYRRPRPDELTAGPIFAESEEG